MTSQFLTEQNLNILFNMMKEYIYARTEYEINEAEWNFLISVMKKSYVPHLPTKELNKQTLDYIIPVVMKKISESLKKTSPQLPQRTMPAMDSNHDVSSTYDKLLKEREPVEQSLPRVRFTDIEPEYTPITSTPQDMMKNRDMDEQIAVPYDNHVAEQFSNNTHTDIIMETKSVDPNKLQSREFKTLQPEPEELKEYYENEKHDLYFQEYMVVDSRDRNHDDYPNANHYRVDLERHINDVISIQLISAEIPKSEYIINNSNNKIYFQETTTQVNNGTYLTASLDIGNYTITELKTEIENKMSTVGTGNYTVTIHSRTKTLSIASDLNGPGFLFSLLFKGNDEIHGHNNNPRSTYLENSIGPVIGFGRIDRVGALTYTGDAQYNLNGETYVMLHLRNIPIIDGVSDGVQNAYHKITLDTSLSVKYYQERDYQIVKKLNNTIKRLNEMEISFRNYNNDLYDFHGLEHSLTFKITSIKGKTI